MTQLERLLAQAGLEERAHVLRTLLGAFDRAQAQQSSPVLLVGVAGAGKTSVLDLLGELVRPRGGAVLRATASPLEVDFPFAVVQQLLGPQPLPAGDAFAVLDALYWALLTRVADGPCLLLLDDAQWADDPSLRWLNYLLRRLAGLRVLPVVAVRPSTDRPLLAALRSLPMLHEVVLPLLSVQATERVLRGRSGQDVPGVLAARCHEVTGGNPFYLSAVARALREQGPAALEAGLRDRASRLPEVVGAAVLDRLRALGPDAVRAVQAVTVLGADAHGAAVSALAGLSQESTAVALGAADDAGLLRVGSCYQVRHPLVHAAVYDQMPASERTRLHREAARQLAATGAEPERVAVHLLATGPGDDIWVVESLLAGARGAIRRGAPETAARYLRRAASEPLARRSAHLLLELGQAELLAGDLGAVESLQEALGLARDDATTAAAATYLARALVHAGQVTSAVQVLRTARQRVQAAVGDTAVRLDMELVDSARLDAHTVAQAEDALAGYGEWTIDLPCGRLVLAHLAYEAARSGRPATLVRELAGQALDGGALLEEQGADAYSTYLPVVALIAADEVEQARAHLDAAVRQSRVRSSALGFCLASLWRSHAALRAGDVIAAGADAEAAVAAADSAALHLLTPYAVAFLSDVLVERGELDAAEHLWREHALDGPLPEVLSSNYLLFSRGSLRLAQGRSGDAAQDLLASGDRQQRWRTTGAGFWPWASRAALALNAQGERDRGEALVHQELAAALAFGAARPLGTALHAAALLEQRQTRLHGLERACEVLADSPGRLDHARAVVDLGVAQIRSGRSSEGRATVEDGLRRAVACGATALAGRARAELVAAGVPSRRMLLGGLEALTISERRVAQLAAGGSTTREIAQALFVTPKTVETHLARTFRKLGVTSRRELPLVPGLLAATSGRQDEGAPVR